VTKPLYSTRMALVVSITIGSVVPICLRIRYDSFWGVFCFCAAVANIVIWKIMQRRHAGFRG
jgi:hypothetical protein